MAKTQTTATKQATRLTDIVAVGFIGLSIVAGALAIFFFLRYGKQQQPPPQQLTGPYPVSFNFQDWAAGNLCSSSCTLNRTYQQDRGLQVILNGVYNNPWSIVDYNGDKALRTRFQYRNAQARLVWDPQSLYPTPYFKLTFDMRLAEQWRRGLRGGGKHAYYPSGGSIGSNWFRFDFNEWDNWTYNPNEPNLGHWNYERTQRGIGVYADVNGQNQVSNWIFGDPDGEYPYPENPPQCTGGVGDNACQLRGEWYRWELTVDCNIGTNDPGTAEAKVYRRSNPQTLYRRFTYTLTSHEKQACTNTGGINHFTIGNYDFSKICVGGRHPGKPCEIRVMPTCQPDDLDCVHAECRDPGEGPPEDNGTCTGEDPQATPDRTWFELDNITVQDLRGPQPQLCVNGQQITQPCLCGNQQYNTGYCCNGVWQQGPCSVENQTPTSTITNPHNGDTVTGTVDVTATATDPDGTIDRVRFYLGDDMQFEDTEAPYTWPWITSENGQAVLRALAVDDDGAVSPIVVGQNQITVTVNNPVQLFSDNFDDGNADGWMPTGTTWLVSNSGESSHYYRSDFSGAGQVYAAGQEFNSLPFEATTRFKKNADLGIAGIHGFQRGGDSSNAYNLYYNYENNTLRLMNDNGRLIDEESLVLNANTWYEMHLTFSAINGVTGTVRADGGQAALATVTADSLYPYPSGTIALYCQNAGNASTHCRFDDVAVTSMTEEAQEPPGGTTYSDDFNDGNANDWSVNRGTWTVDSNEYRSTHTTSDDRYSWADNQTFTTLPFDVKAKVKLESGVGPIGITAYRTSDSSQYRFVYVKTQQKLYLYKGATALPGGTLSGLNLPITAWHRMKLSISQEGNGVKLEGRIWADGAQVPDLPSVTATDASPLTVGTIGLYCRDTGTICRFDDVTVTGPGGTTPGGGGSPVFLKIEPESIPDPGIPQD